MKGQLKKKKNTKTNVEVEDRDWRSLSLGDSVRCGDDDELERDGEKLKVYLVKKCKQV